MAEGEAAPKVDLSADVDETPGYKPPAEKSLGEILNQDQEDESLQKYKATLLGAAGPADTIFWPEDPRSVIVKALSLVVEGREDVTRDLSGDLSNLKSQSFIIKEGCQYKLRINFCVQREIVTGLKLVNKVTRKGIKVDSNTYMVGSYGPKTEEQSYLTPADEAPEGMLMRGHYTVASCFTDDDKNKILEWVWTFDIKKDWA